MIQHDEPEISVHPPVLRHEQRRRGAVAQVRRVGGRVRAVRLHERRLQRSQLFEGGVPLDPVLLLDAVHGDYLYTREREREKIIGKILAKMFCTRYKILGTVDGGLCLQKAVHHGIAHGIDHGIALYKNRKKKKRYDDARRIHERDKKLLSINIYRDCRDIYIFFNNVIESPLKPALFFASITGYDIILRH